MLRARFTEPSEGQPIAGDEHPIARLLYMSGGDAVVDAHVQTLIAEAAPHVRLTAVRGAPDVIRELVNVETAYEGLLLSPAGAQQEAVQIIARVRADRLAVPVLSLQHRPDQDSYAAVVRAGADGVLAIDGCTPAELGDALDRLRRSPHYQPPAAPRRLRVLYVGHDWLVWKLLEVVPFISAARAESEPDGSCPIQSESPATGAFRCEAVLVDEPAGPAAADAVVAWLSRTAPDLPVIRLARQAPAGTKGSASDADTVEVVEKAGVYRPRLVAALRRVHRIQALMQENAALAARSAWLDHVVDRLPDGLLVLSPFGTIRAANRAGIELLGADSLQDVVDRPLAAWFDADQRRDLEDAVRDATAGRVHEFTLQVGSEDEPRAIDVRLEPLHPAPPAPAGAVVRVLPGTRREAEEAAPGSRDEVAALRQARDEIESAHRADRERWDADRRAFEDTLGELRQALADASATFDHDRARWEAVRHNLERAIEAEQSRSDRLARELGRRTDQWALDSSTLQAIADRLAQAFDRLTGCRLFAYAVTSPDGHLLRCNESFARLFGYADPDDALRSAAGMPVPGLTGTDGLDLSDPAAATAVRFEDCLATADGRKLSVMRWTGFVPARPSEPACLEHVLIDLTPQSQAEERLRDTRRVAQLGTLASLMMPDITAGMAALDDLVREASSAAPGTGERRASLDHLAEGIGRARGLVEQLAAFGRRQERPRERMALGDALARSAPTLRHLAGPDVTVELAPGAPADVMASEVDVEQMLTSLVIAARDLLPLGGRVTLSTRRPDPSDRQGDCRPHPLRPVRLEVVAEGYEVQAGHVSPALERVVSRCDGTVRLSARDTRRVAFDVDLPSACPER